MTNARKCDNTKSIHSTEALIDRISSGSLIRAHSKMTVTFTLDVIRYSSDLGFNGQAIEINYTIYFLRSFKAKRNIVY